MAGRTGAQAREAGMMQMDVAAVLASLIFSMGDGGCLYVCENRDA